MNEGQIKKNKISKLALVCSLIPTIVIFGSALMIAIVQSKGGCLSRVPPMVKMLLGLLVTAGPMLAPASFIIGIAAIIEIFRSKGIKRGYRLSILGLLLSVWSFPCACGALATPRNETTILFCQTNLEEVGSMIGRYKNEHENEYPKPEQWCDLLSSYDSYREGIFMCPEGGKRDECTYAMNPNCTPDSSSDMVLLFECKGGWNQSGGAELLSFRHCRLKVPLFPFMPYKGCNILFNDGQAKFIKSEQVDELNW